MRINALYAFEEIHSSTNQIETDCNSISFLNQGDAPLMINKTIQLSPGDPMLTLGAAGVNEYLRQRFTADFATGANPKLIVIRKTFTT